MNRKHGNLWGHGPVFDLVMVSIWFLVALAVFYGGLGWLLDHL